MPVARVWQRIVLPLLSVLRPLLLLLLRPFLCPSFIQQLTTHGAFLVAGRSGENHAECKDSNSKVRSSALEIALLWRPFSALTQHTMAEVRAKPSAPAMIAAIQGGQEKGLHI